MSRKVVRRKTERQSPEMTAGDTLLQMVEDFLGYKRQAAMISERERETKKILSELVEGEGYEDEKGNIWLDLPAPVEGVNAKGEKITVTKLKRERRVSQSLDPEVAEKILRKKKLWDRCIRLVPVLDEEEILKAHYEGELTEDEIDDMHPTTSNYAFKTEA